MSDTIKMDFFVQTYEVPNGLIGLEPFKSEVVEKTGTTKGFAVIKQKVELAELKVVFGNDKVMAGSTVFVDAELYATTAGKRVYDIEGQKVIFLPFSEVKLIKHAPVWRI